MKKFYSLVLMAAALLIGTTASAVNVASWSELQNAIASPNAEITLTAYITLPTTGGTWDFNGAVIDCKYETVSATTSNDTVIYSYLYASKAKTYELQNVTLKNYQGSYGAIRGNAANAVINLGNTVNIIDSKYSVYAAKAATITNAGNIAGVYMKAGGSLTNSGTITSAAAAGITAAGTTTIENQAGAEIAGATYGISIANGTVNNNGTITAGTYGVYVSGQTEFINDGAINAASKSFYAAAAAQMTITNNANIDWSVYPYRANANSHVITNNAGNLTFYGYGSKAAYNFQGSVTIENAASANVILANTTFTCPLELTNVTINGGTFNGQLSGSNITINGGTFNGQLSGSNITIHGGTFAVAPAAGIDGYIEPQNALPKFEAGVGDLTIAPGYVWRSIDKYVAPEAGVVEVAHANGSHVTCLIEEAFANAIDGDVITLLEDVTSYSTLWLGTAEANGAFKSVTLDLNGHTLSSETNVKNTILLTRGALYIKNSVPGQGGIVHLRDNAPSAYSEIIFVCGSPTRMMKGSAYVNPRNAAVTDLFAYLLIDEGVTLSANGYGVNGISVYENASGNHPAQLNYRDAMYVDANSKWGLAGGVRIDVKGTINATKYAGKVNGLVRHPNEVVTEYPGMTDVQAADTANGTFFHIFPTAVMHTSDALEATAVYCSGYARWLIEGLCQGATGVYVKSGVVDLTDAIVESTYTGTASITTGGGSGVAAGGNAVVIESNDHYTGEQALVIGGDTKISTEAEGGAAVVDIVDDTHESKVESIVINGGSFTGDNAIVISSETASEQTTTVNGVTVTGEISVGGSTDPADVADIMGSNTHTTEIENADGSKTVVISAGDAPAAATEWVDVAALTPGSNAKWTGFTAGVIANGATVNLGELQIISADGTTGKELQQLTIENGAVLNVERLIMNDYARIIVEAGGKLIVSGTQGINAPVVENIVLKCTSGAQAMFIFNPSVTSNRHPNATVEMYTTSHMLTASPWTYAYQRFAIPVQQGVAPSNDFSGELFPGEEAYGFETYVYDWDGHNWNFCSTWAGLEPFKGYQLANNSKLGGVTYSFKGELVGNGDAEYNFPTGGFDFFGSSHLAPIYIDSLLKPYESTNMEASVWLYDYTSHQFAAVTSDDIHDGFAPEEIQPMDGFVLKINGASGQSGMNYASAIWGNPNLDAVIGRPSQKNNAPARNRANNIATNRAFINVMAENGNGDIVKLVEKDVYTAQFDNGSDASKFMFAEGINLYATTEAGDLARVATDDLLGTLLSFRSGNSTEYTITMTNVLGEDYALRDNVTGQVIVFAEGATYTFMQDANTTVPARFEVVEAAKMPTAIDNVDEAAKANGIYTITGQYMGRDFTKLPAGVYIVNGVKVVK